MASNANGRVGTLCEKIGMEVSVVIFKTFWETLKRIINPISVFVTFIFLLAIWALHLFRGALTKKCIRQLPDGNLTSTEIVEFLSNTDNWDHDTGVCGSDHDCSYQYKCVDGYGPNPTYGYENFDNIVTSYLAVLVIALCDFWEQTCRQVIKSKGNVYIIYFVISILTSYCIFYTIQAVVFTAFNKYWVEDEKAYTETVSKVEAKDDIPFIDEDEQNGLEHVKSTYDSGRAGGSQPVVSVAFQNTAPKTGLRKFLDACCYWECCSCCTKFRNICKIIVLDPFVQQFIVIFLLVDISIMATDRHNLEEGVARGYRYCFYFFTLVYFVEFVMKLIALSFLGYFKVGWNVLEFFIVFGTIIGMGLENIAGLSAFGLLEWLKLYRIARYWPTFYHAVRIQSRTYKVHLVFLLILATFILIMAAIGTHVLGENYEIKKHYWEAPPRWHMMDYWHSFLLIYRAICGEWVESMYDAMLVSGYSCSIFFFVFVVFGDIVMVNLYTVFQVAYIAKEGKKEAQEDENTLIEVMAESADRLLRVWNAIASRLFRGRITYIRQMKDRSNNSRVSDANAATQVNRNDSAVINCEDSTTTFPGLNRVGNQTTEPEDCCPSCCCPRNCADWNWWKSLRRFCLGLVNNWIFEWFAIVSIIVNCALLASKFENFDKQATTHSVQAVFVFVVMPIIFFLETAIRLLGLGAKGYFRSGYRCWDFFFVALFILDAIIGLMGVAHVPMSRIVVFRLFRLLGQTWRFEASRAVINTIFESFPGLVNVFIQGLFIWLFFAVIGVQMFAGKFYRCVDQDGNRVNASFIEQKMDCLSENMSWVNPDTHFDNVLDAFLSLSEIATFKGWINIIHNAMDSKSVDLQPDEEINTYTALYFIIFALFGSYYTYVLWFSVLIDGFNRQRKRTEDERGIVNPEDDLYYKAVRIMSSKTPNQPQIVDSSTNKLVAQVQSLANSMPFNVLALTVIVLNVILLSLTYSHEPQAFYQALNITVTIFLVLYCAEIALRVIARGISFVKDPVNVLDVVAIVLIIISLSYQDCVETYLFPPVMLRLVRVSKIIQQYKWMKRFPGIRRVFSTLRKTTPYFFVIVLLEALVIFCYAFVGMYLWRGVKRFGNSGSMFFNTLGESIIILCQLMTTSGWDGFLTPLMNERDCEKENCGDKTLAVLYLTSFLTVSFLLLMTLLTVVVLEMYSEAGVEELERLENEQMDHFYRTWSQYDKDATGYLDLNQLASLLDLQGNAFGFRKTGESSLASLDVTIVEGERVHHRDVLDALFRWSLREKGVEIKNVEAFDGLEHPEADYKPISSTLWRKREEASVAKIQKAWGQYKDQRL